jgi:hypothetical protein
VQQRHDLALIAQIQRCQGLVEDQHLWPAHERLGDRDALALAARQLGEPPVGHRRGVDALEHHVDTLAVRAGSARESPTASVQPEHHRVAGADRLARHRSIALWDVTDRFVDGARGFAENPDATRRGGN